MLTVYSKNNCPYCVQAKQLLESKGVEYTEVNIEHHPEARQKLVDAGLRSVPQIYNGDFIVEGGFNGLNKQPAEWWTMVKKGLDTDLPSEYQVYYLNKTQHDSEIEDFLNNSNAKWESFFIDEHLEDYDHDKPDEEISCFCRVPDYTDDRWPKVYKSNGLVVAGKDAVLQFNFSKEK